MFKKTKIAAMTAVVLGLSSMAISPTAHAVSVAEGGSTGQVLIFPYYNVNNGFVTGFNITNTTDKYKAVKMRFRESGTSNDVLDFNVYMSPFDVFAVALGQTGDGGVLLTTKDKTCTFPAIPEGGVTFRDVYDSVEPEDMREGYLEVIEMGEVKESAKVGDKFITTDGILHDSSGTPIDCSVINSAWQGGIFTQGGSASNGAGIHEVLADSPGFPTNAVKVVDAAFYGEAEPDNLNPPTGGLMGSEVLIDSVNVAGFVAEPVTINNYSDKAQHYLSSDENFYLLPSLASGSILTMEDLDQSANPATLEDATWTTVARDFGLDDKNVLPRISVPSGINPMPMAHAMAVTGLMNQFLLGGETSTDFVVAAPMRKHGIYNDFQYVTGAANFDDTKDIPVAGNETNGYWKFLDVDDVNAPFIFWNREEAKDEPEAGDFSPPVNTAGVNVPFEREVNILALSLTTTSNPSVLGSDNAQNLEITTGFESGWGKFTFSNYDLAAARYTDWVAAPAGTAGTKGVPLSGFIAARGAIGGQSVGETFPHGIMRTR